MLLGNLRGKDLGQKKKKCHMCEIKEALKKKDQITSV